MISDLSIKKIREGILNEEFTAQTVVKEYLASIDASDKDINAFISVDGVGVLEQAKFIDDNKKDLPLLGAPIAVKDNILVKGLRCTAGSNILKDYTATYDATVIKRLKKAGAIILGKLNMDEFAMGSSGEYSAFGPTKNPRHKDYVPGGSSSGPGASVAGNMCVASLGSDTGGSIRQPASFCGVVGLKPTYGAVSRNGLIALSSSLDQIGPMGKSVEDVETIFNVISGKDELDATTFGGPIKNPIIDFSGLKIGLPKEYFAKGLNKEVEASVRSAIKKYEEAGAQIVDISLPYSQYGLAVYQILLTAEASSNLARFDGMRYGARRELIGEADNDLLGVYLASRSGGFSDEVRRRIMLGTFVLSAGYYDAYYTRALQVRAKIKNDFDEAFKKVDFIMTPTTPTTPFKFGEKMSDPLSMYLADIFTVSVNLAGLPAISIPCYNVNDLPVGLQIIGKPFEEHKLFAIAKIFEQSK